MLYLQILSARVILLSAIISLSTRVVCYILNFHSPKNYKVFTEHLPCTHYASQRCKVIQVGSMQYAQGGNAMLFVSSKVICSNNKVRVNIVREVGVWIRIWDGGKKTIVQNRR